MTTKQKQWQLYLLGYYGSSEADIDGKWGKNSHAGTCAFQAAVGLNDHGVFDMATVQASMELIARIQEAVKKYAGENFLADGFGGRQTKNAVAGYQKSVGMEPTGIADELTRTRLFSGYAAPAEKPTEEKTEAEAEAEAEADDWWQGIHYFDRTEFRCKCGGKYCNGFPVEPARDLVELLDVMRKRLNTPCDVSSGIRCEKHNELCDGAEQSQHLFGTAADVSFRGVAPEAAAACAEQLMPDTGGIGVYSWGIHVDTRKVKSRWDG